MTTLLHIGKLANASPDELRDQIRARDDNIARIERLYILSATVASRVEMELHKQIDEKDKLLSVWLASIDGLTADVMERDKTIEKLQADVFVLRNPMKSGMYKTDAVASEGCQVNLPISAPTDQEVFLKLSDLEIPESQRMVTVCNACWRAICFKGEIMCDEALHAGTVEKSVTALRELHLEHPDCWETP